MPNILVLNSGSSTLKASLQQVGAGPLPPVAPTPAWSGRADWGRDPGKATVTAAASHGGKTETVMAITGAGAVVEPLLKTIWEGPAKVLDGPAQIDAVGHRVVHGGDIRETGRITPELEARIAQYIEYAPQHNRTALDAIKAAKRVLNRDAPHIAVFDTAFHATLPQVAVIYPGPYEWFEHGIRRYGFHGISHQYVRDRAAEILRRDVRSMRLITCHLGNGCSLAAIREGKCIDTTMGFTPLDGIMMGSRSGSVDPGILIHLMRNRGAGADDLDDMLNTRSGLRGVSGISGDMRELMRAIDRGDQRAKLAFDVYAHRLCQGIGAMLASLGGLDALVFTAGVGENCPPLREIVCARFGFLGVRIDAARNENSPVDTDIAAPESSIRILVVHTDEDWAITRETAALVFGARAAETAETAPRKF